VKRCRSKRAIGYRPGAFQTAEAVPRLDEIHPVGRLACRWGRISARQWGTVREDYKRGLDSWGYFPMTRPAAAGLTDWRRTGLGGFSDVSSLLLFSGLALWRPRTRS